MRVVVPVGMTAFLAAYHLVTVSPSTSVADAFDPGPLEWIFYAVFLGYLGYCGLYFVTAYVFPGVDVRAEPEIVDQGDTVRLHVEVSGSAAFSPDQLEAFVSKRRIYQGVNRGLFKHSGWINPRLLFERTQSLDDASLRHGRVTVEFDLPEHADPTSHDHHSFTGITSIDRWDVGIRIQSPMYPSYHFFVPFVVRRPDREVTEA